MSVRELERVIRRAMELCTQIIVQSRISFPSQTTTELSKSFNIRIPQVNLGQQNAIDWSQPFYLSILFGDKPPSPSNSSNSSLGAPQNANPPSTLERWRIAFERGRGDPIEISIISRNIAVLLRLVHSIARLLPCQSLVQTLRRNHASHSTLYFKISNFEDSFLLDEFEQKIIGRVPTQYGTLNLTSLVKRNLSKELSIASESLIQSRIIVEDYTNISNPILPPPSTTNSNSENNINTANTGLPPISQPISASPLSQKIAAFKSHQQQQQQPMGSAPIPISNKGSIIITANTSTNQQTATQFIATSVEPSPAFAMKTSGGGTSLGTTPHNPLFPSSTTTSPVGSTPPFSYHSFQPVYASKQQQQQQQQQQQGSSSPSQRTSIVTQQINAIMPPKQSATISRMPLMSYYTPLAENMAGNSSNSNNSNFGTTTQASSSPPEETKGGESISPREDEIDGQLAWMPMPEDDEDDPAFAVPDRNLGIGHGNLQQQQLLANRNNNNNSSNLLNDVDDFLRLCVDPPKLGLFSLKPSITVDALCGKYNPQELFKLLNTSW